MTKIQACLETWGNNPGGAVNVEVSGRRVVLAEEYSVCASFRKGFK
jgi:hypothetical protein